MSKASDAFVERVQENRGKIKSQKHIDMLHTIYHLGSDSTQAQAESKKMVGIAFIESVATQLDEANQEKFWEEFMTKPSQDITTAKLLLVDYVTTEGGK